MQRQLEFLYGTTGDLPIAGDWDGNGTWTPGVIRSGNTWKLRNSNTAGFADVAFVYGQAGDRYVTGDWDGNRTFTPGVVRGNRWLLRNANSAGANDIPAFTYEQAGDRPVAGDYDRDGRWTPAVVRDGIWLVRNDFAGGTAEDRFGFGAPTDTPMFSRGRRPAPRSRRSIGAGSPHRLPPTPTPRASPRSCATPTATPW